MDGCEMMVWIVQKQTKQWPLFMDMNPYTSVM